LRQLPLGVRIPDRAVFASFLPARNSQLVAHLEKVARGDVAGTSWVCGPRGSGKTHLLQATCVASSGGRRAGYFPLSEFEPLGVEALEGLTQLECVCCDDIDGVVGKLEWERALFGLMREIDERGAGLVVAAQAPPALLPWLLPDLGSRFGASAVFQLRALDEAEQVQALQLHAQQRGFELPDETAHWLQKRYPRDMRTLHTLLDKLDEAALVAQRKLTVPFIRDVLRE
jgi:DnaA family protein